MMNYKLQKGLALVSAIGLTAALFSTSPAFALEAGEMKATMPAVTVVAYGEFDDALEVPTSSISNESSDSPKLNVTKTKKYFSRSEKTTYDSILDPMYAEYNVIYNELIANVYDVTSDTTYNNDLSMTRFSAVLTDFVERYTALINGQKSSYQSNLKNFLTYFVNQLKIEFHEQTDIRLSTFKTFESKNYCDLLFLENKYYTVSSPKSNNSNTNTASTATEFSRVAGPVVTPPVNPGTPGAPVTDANGNVSFNIGTLAYKMTGYQYQVYANYATSINVFYQSITDYLNKGSYNVKSDEPIDDTMRRFFGDLNYTNRACFGVFSNDVDAYVKGAVQAYLNSMKASAMASFATHVGTTVAAINAYDAKCYDLRTSTVYGTSPVRYVVVEYPKNAYGQVDFNNGVDYGVIQYTVLYVAEQPTQKPNTSAPNTPNSGGYHDADGNPVNSDDIYKEIPSGFKK